MFVDISTTADDLYDKELDPSELTLALTDYAGQQCVFVFDSFGSDHLMLGGMFVNGIDAFIPLFVIDFSHDIENYKTTVAVVKDYLDCIEDAEIEVVAIFM